MLRAPAPASFDIAWFSFIDEEWISAHAALEYVYPDDINDYKSRNPHLQGDSNTYCLGKIREYNIVLVRPPTSDDGPVNTAGSLTDLTRSFTSLKYYLLAGVAGGVPYNDGNKPDVRLGDVVVGMPGKDHPGVITTEYGRWRSEFQATGNILPPEQRLQQCTKIIVDPIRPNNQYLAKFNENARNLLLKRDIRRPSKDSDQLFKADYPCESKYRKCPDQCSLKNLIKRSDRPRDHPTVHLGLIASSSAVFQNAAIRDERVEQNSETGDILCFEMEAYAVALRQRCLTIRGICDYADLHKIYHWQPYAAVRAAAFARTIVEILSFINPHNPRPNDPLGLPGFTGPPGPPGPPTPPSEPASPLGPKDPEKPDLSHEPASPPIRRVSTGITLTPESSGGSKRQEIEGRSLSSGMEISDESLRRCRFSIRCRSTKPQDNRPVNGELEFRFVPHNLQSGFCCIHYCQIPRFQLPTKVLTLLSDDKSHKTQYWIPSDNVQAKACARGCEYWWPDCESVVMTRRHGYDILTLGYNPEKPNMTLKIEFDDRSDSNSFRDDILDSGLRQAGLRIQNDFEVLKSLDGAYLEINKTEPRQRRDSAPRSDSNSANLTMVLEKIVERELCTLFALSEPFQAKIETTDDGENFPFKVLLNFKYLRYANKALPDNDHYRPTDGIYRLEERSTSGIPAKELWVPQVEGGLPVSVGTFQAILERTTHWRSVYHGKVEMKLNGWSPPRIRNPLVFLGRRLEASLCVMAYALVDNLWFFFEVRSPSQADIKSRNNVLSIGIKSWKKSGDFKLDMLERPFSNSVSLTLSIEFRDWNDAHKFRETWTQLYP